MNLKQMLSQLPVALHSQAPALYRRFVRIERQPSPKKFLIWLQSEGFWPKALETEGTFELNSETTLGTMVDCESESEPAAKPAPVPETTVRSAYVLLGVLGQGAMGLVHLAKDSDLQRKVAYKQLLGEHAKRRISLARFLSEAQITAQLEHPNVVPIYSMETTADGSLAYTMKLVHGKTFKELMQETRQLLDQDLPLDDEHTPTRLLEHFLKVCDALDYAHSKGVIHRDLKPANIMVGAYNEVYVMDWGIARLIKGEEIPTDDWVELANIHGDEPLEERTQVGQILGTPRYMSPQQAAGKNNELDGRSDLFSLGLILYELVALKPAITASTPMELLKRVLKARLEPLVPYHARFPVAPELRAIIAKATRRKPENRYNSVKDMAADLRRYLKGDAVLAQPDTPMQALLRWMRQHRQLTLGGVLLVVFLGVTALISLQIYKQSTMAAAHQREKKLSQFLTQVALQAQRLNQHFLDLELLLEGLNATVTENLVRGVPTAEPAYGLAGFKPPDLKFSPAYQQSISMGWPLFAWTTAAKPFVQKIIPQMNQLREDLQLTWAGYPAADQLKRALTVTNLHSRKNIARIKTGLPQGIQMIYPGYQGSPPVPLELAPWYQSARQRFQPVWGSPYRENLTDTLMVDCSSAMYNEHNRFLGVVALGTLLDDLVAGWMNTPPVGNVTAIVNQIWLLDQAGRVLVDSEKKLALNTVFPNPMVLKAILQQQSGYYESADSGSKQLVAYYRIQTQGWYYVVKVDTATMLQTTDTQRSISDDKKE